MPTLHISYALPPGGFRIYDKLAQELAGPHATVTSFGSLMTTTRTLTYEYPTQETRDQAEARLTNTGIFKTIKGD